MPHQFVHQSDIERFQKNGVVLIKGLFADHVDDLRKTAGYSQEGFAHECGLDRTYIGGVERGERNASLDNIERLADTLGLEISALFETDLRK